MKFVVASSGSQTTVMAAVAADFDLSLTRLSLSATESEEESIKQRNVNNRTHCGGEKFATE